MYTSPQHIYYSLYTRTWECCTLLLWQCRIIFAPCGTSTPRRSGPPFSRGFYIIRNDSPRSVGLLLKYDQLVAEIKWVTTHNTHFTTDKHPCRRRESKPQSQQGSGPRPTSLTARPLAPAWRCRTRLQNLFRNSDVISLGNLKEAIRL